MAYILRQAADIFLFFRKKEQTSSQSACPQNRGMVRSGSPLQKILPTHVNRQKRYWSSLRMRLFNESAHRRGDFFTFTHGDKNVHLWFLLLRRFSEQGQVSPRWDSVDLLLECTIRLCKRFIIEHLFLGPSSKRRWCQISGHKPRPLYRYMYQKERADNSHWKSFVASQETASLTADGTQ